MNSVLQNCVLVISLKHKNSPTAFTNQADDVTDTDGRIVVNTGPFGGFQISVGTIGNEAEGGLVVVETDGAQCAGRVACRTGLCARCVLA